MIISGFRILMYLILSFGLNLQVMFAQSYAPIKSGGYLIYTDENLSFGLRADSVIASGSDTIYYFLPNVNVIPSKGYPEKDCYQLNGPSWLGKRAVYKGNGEYHYFNKEDETILLKTIYPLNSEWTCYSRSSDTISVRVKIIKQDTLTYLGIMDSVKIFLFSVLDKNGDIRNLPINGKAAILSKSYGFFEAPNFNQFPDFESLGQPISRFSPSSVTLTMAGVSWISRGLLNFTLKDAFNFEVGDEFHILEGRYGLNYPVFKRDSIFIIQKVEKKFNRNDTLFIEMSNTIKEIHITLSGDGSSNVISDVYRNNSIKTISHHLLLDQLPGESNQFNRLNLFIENSVLKKSLVSTNQYYKSDSCYLMYLSFDISDNHSEYWDGFGGPYYNNDYDYFSGDFRVLKYYKKGTRTWGTPFSGIVLNAENKWVSKEPLLSPNPVSNILNITSSPNQEIQITDLSGKIIEEFQMDSNPYFINTSTYRSGMYICKGLNFTKKFVVE